ncbi:peroxiredoxin family protein [Parabacteroides provencensis]|uniref:peroxiredoxin family protein n=1 Tax=Parabacteroides provencensis TaxID=1944636 RepID=UPI000C1574A8|nr:TlpA disulfide reductase family protein [Parabacteroides provencensis]
MKTRLLIISVFLLSAMTNAAQDMKKDYLGKVLDNLEKIESATYTEIMEAWEPGDTIASYRTPFIVNEYNNPIDTIIGASYACFTPSIEFYGGYDGEKKAIVYDEDKIIVLDDFTARKLPFRLVTPPFFSFTKNVIKYALETNDKITMELDDMAECYHFKLTIKEDKQVEFFGKAYYMDNPYAFDPTSVYELWIRKSDDLPYKYRREQCHNISVVTCQDVECNRLSIEDFNLSDYFPKDFEVRMYGQKRNVPVLPELTGIKAPDWTLNDIKEKTVSLSDIKSKVVLLEFTGIGCGPCMVSIPFLNKLKDDFGEDKLEVVAIETWKRNAHSGQNYVDKHNITYMFLSATDAVIKDYRTGGAAPVFFILDEHRTIRKIINGYNKEVTDKEILDAITGLLE